MGLMSAIFGALFGGGRNVVKETAEVFRENAEASAQRDAAYNHAALAQYAAEFAIERKGWFDRFIDGLNRLPRPAMALGVLGLFVAAMWEPIWFAERMTGLALVPEQLWWLLGIIVTFYFGARHDAKQKDHEKSIAQSMARIPAVTKNLETLADLRHDNIGSADTGTDSKAGIDAVASDDNPALMDWKNVDHK